MHDLPLSRRGVRRLLLASVPQSVATYGYPTQPPGGQTCPPRGCVTRDGGLRHRRSHQATHSTPWWGGWSSKTTGA